eukprot:g20360.t1
MDVQSLYTCIPHVDGLKAPSFFLSRRPNQSPSNNTLIHLTELVLTLNNFSFYFSHFLRRWPWEPASSQDTWNPLSHYYTGTIPHLLLRYIDDCIGAASCSNEELEQFINFTNTFHPDLKFTWIISDTSLSFLDLPVSISGDRLETDIYFKSTDTYSDLDNTSSHPTFLQECDPLLPNSSTSA